MGKQEASEKRKTSWFFLKHPLLGQFKPYSKKFVNNRREFREEGQRYFEERTQKNLTKQLIYYKVCQLFKG